jgi:hypothetical protein
MYVKEYHLNFKQLKGKAPSHNGKFEMYYC